MQSLIQLRQEEEAEAVAMAALDRHSHAPCLHLSLATLLSKNNSRLQEVCYDWQASKPTLSYELIYAYL